MQVSRRENPVEAVLRTAAVAHSWREVFGDEAYQPVPEFGRLRGGHPGTVLTRALDEIRTEHSRRRIGVRLPEVVHRASGNYGHLVIRLNRRDRVLRPASGAGPPA